VSIKEAETIVGFVGRKMVESIELDGVSMAGISPDSGEFWAKVRAEIA
jgi:hypothetical protein